MYYKNNKYTNCCPLFSEKINEWGKCVQLVKILRTLHSNSGTYVLKPIHFWKSQSQSTQIHTSNLQLRICVMLIHILYHNHTVNYMYRLVIQLKISNTEWQKWHDAYSELLHLQVSSYELIKVNWIFYYQLLIHDGETIYYMWSKWEDTLKWLFVIVF